MSLKSLVTRQVANAFTQLGDLKQTIVFEPTSNRTYDFAAGDVTEASSSISIEGIVESVTNSGNGVLDGIQVSFIINKADLPNSYSQFDSFTTNGTTYKIVDYTDNGYSIEGKGVAE